MTHRISSAARSFPRFSFAAVLAVNWLVVSWASAGAPPAEAPFVPPLHWDASAQRVFAAPPVFVQEWILAGRDSADAEAADYFARYRAVVHAPGFGEALGVLTEIVRREVAARPGLSEKTIEHLVIPTLLESRPDLRSGIAGRGVTPASRPEGECYEDRAGRAGCDEYSCNLFTCSCVKPTCKEDPVDQCTLSVRIPCRPDKSTLAEREAF